MTSYNNLSSSAILFSPRSPASGTSGSLPRNHSFQDLNSLKQSYEEISVGSPISRYEQDFIEFEEVGTGGFGKVYKVKNKLDGETYAMKKIVFKKKINPTQLKKVLREVKALARLDHPNIVRYYQAWIEEKSEGNIFSKRYSSSLTSSESEDEEEGVFAEASATELDISPEDRLMFEWQDEPSDVGPSPKQQTPLEKPWSSVRMEIQMSLQPVQTTTLYIQMQLCGDTLQNWLDARQTIDPNQSLYIFKQICKGLKYIHSQKIIHRDLKPANIFLSQRDLVANPDGSDRYIVVLGDFGLAVNLFEDDESDEENSTIANKPSARIHTTGIGTHTYASPEQINHEHYDEKVDVFSLGIIFFELFYQFNTKMERSKTLTNLRKGILPPGFDKNLGKMILWLLSPNPKQRPRVSDILDSDLFQSETINLPKDEYQRMKMRLEAQQALIEKQQHMIEQLQTQLCNVNVQTTAS